MIVDGACRLKGLSIQAEIDAAPVEPFGIIAPWHDLVEVFS